MCSLSMNGSMLFLLLRTTLLALTACIVTVYGAPVHSDTQAMVRKFSLTIGNKSYYL
jgi:peptidoglycan/LPS O-acetylase OafA/YrhL